MDLKNSTLMLENPNRAPSAESSSQDRIKGLI